MTIDNGLSIKLTFKNILYRGIKAEWIGIINPTMMIPNTKLLNFHFILVMAKVAILAIKTVSTVATTVIQILFQK